MKTKKEKIKSFKIDYKKWGTDALFATGNKKLCCLGFLGRACGLSDAEMADRGMPEETYKYGNFPDVTGWAFAGINDDVFLNKAEKMALISRGFKIDGIKVIWQNVPPSLEKKRISLLQLRSDKLAKKINGRLEKMKCNTLQTIEDVNFILDIT